MGVMVIDQKTFATLLIVLAILGIILLVRSIFRLIKWLLTSIWCLLTGKRRRRNPLESDDWLTRAQARQEIRFENSLPPITPKQQPRRRRKSKGKDKNRYATGWTLNQETGLWEPPDYLSREAKQRWQWDEGKRIWIDKFKR